MELSSEKEPECKIWKMLGLYCKEWKSVFWRDRKGCSQRMTWLEISQRSQEQRKRGPKGNSEIIRAAKPLWAQDARVRLTMDSKDKPAGLQCQTTTAWPPWGTHFPDPSQVWPLGACAVWATVAALKTGLATNFGWKGPGLTPAAHWVHWGSITDCTQIDFKRWGCLTEPWTLGVCLQLSNSCTLRYQFSSKTNLRPIPHALIYCAFNVNQFLNIP